MIAGVAWVHGWVLFTAPLGLDEFHTLFLAEKGSFLRSMSDLAAGSDFNPPLLYGLERLVGHITGGITRVSLRMTCVLSVWLALVFVFLALRRNFPPTAAFVGSFAVWSNTIVAQLAFEGRFYGPWLLFCAMVVWSLGWDEELEASRRRDVAVAVSSVLVCTIHYFGIFSLGLIAAGAAVSIALNGRTYRRLLPMTAGPVAFALCYPFYAGQRASLSVKTWISPLSAHQIREMFEFFVFAGPVLAGALILLLWIGWLRIRRFPTRSLRDAITNTLPFTALLLMPATLIAMSVLVQPSMQLRYAIPAALAWAPVIAMAADISRWPGKLFLLSLALFFSVRAIDSRAVALADYRSRVESEASLASPFLDSGIVMVASRATLYPLAATTGRASKLVFPDYPDSVARTRRLPPVMMLDRDIARVHARLYGFPTLAPVDAPEQTTKRYFLLPLYGTSYTISLLFPNNVVTQMAPRIYRIGSARQPSETTSFDPVNRAMGFLYKNHDPATAIAVLDSLLASDPGHYGALWQRAAALQTMGRRREAIQAWRKVISEAEQNGWQDGLDQAKRRLLELDCNDDRNPERSITASILRWYRCARL